MSTPIPVSKAADMRRGPEHSTLTPEEIRRIVLEILG
jgi:hypothetical protein